LPALVEAPCYQQPTCLQLATRKLHWEQRVALLLTGLLMQLG
jgi:hypothetical protein